mgnify:CR=1 FL=1|tara:strand:+ start:1101 stop:1322 length:222 start_codon:yes stop_codon:yes gene_type:complete
MTENNYIKGQHRLTNIAGVAGTLAVVFAVDGYNLRIANDITPFGLETMPWIVAGLVAVTLLAVTAKVFAHLKR